MQRYIQDIKGQYFLLLQELEQYGYYILRCLHRMGIHPQPTDFTHITFLRNNGQIAEGICYPATAINQTLQTIDNPMFFYGFKADYDFKDMSYPIKITFSENYEELLK